MAGHGRRRPWAAVGAAILLVVATAPVRSGADLARREIIATGDMLPGGARVGRSSVSALGIDGAGRVLFSAHTSAGIEALFRAGAAGVVEAVWTSTTEAARPARLYRARTNAAGRVVASGFATRNNWGDLLGYYEIAPGVVRPIVERGDVTPDGERICALGEEFALNDAGAVALDAWTLPDGEDCAIGEWARRLFVATGDGLTTVLRDRLYEVVGLTDEGAVILNMGMAVFAARDGRLTPVVTRDELGPGSIESIRAVDANGAGDVTLMVRAGAEMLLRADRDRIVRLLTVGEHLADGSRIAGINSPAWINDAGDVAVTLILRPPDQSHRTATMLAPASGALALVDLGSGTAAGINDVGQVALSDYEPGLAVVRAAVGERLRLVGPGAAAPGGGFLVSGGLEGAPCLGADGRVAAVATDQTERDALVCADARGLTTIARSGGPTPEGGPFAAFTRCAFETDGAVVFLAARELPTELRDWRAYRADATGIRTVAGPGMRTVDGEVVERLLPFLPLGDFTEPDLMVNARRTVLVKARTASGDHYLRAYPDGRLERVPVDVGGERPVRRLGTGGLTDDDTVIAELYFHGESDGGQAIVAAASGAATVLTTAADPTLPGGPYNGFYSLLVAGSSAVVSASGSSGMDRSLLLTPDRTFTLLSPPPPARPIGITPAGTVLVERLEAGHSEYLTADAAGARPLAAFDQPGDPQIVAINDRGNVLLHTWVNELNIFRQNLALSGPTPAAACPVVPTVAPAPTDTPRLAPTVRPTATPSIPPTATEASTPTSTPTAVLDLASDADDDGCQIGMPRTSAIAWMPLLPALLALARRRFLKLAGVVAGLVPARTRAIEPPQGPRLLGTRFSARSRIAVAGHSPRAAVDGASVAIMTSPPGVATGATVDHRHGRNTDMITTTLRLIAATMSMLALQVGTAGAAVDLTPSPILSSGDVVEGLGVIGVADINAAGIDANGRVLVIASLNTGVNGLYWADEAGLRELYVPAFGGPWLSSAVTSQTGTVVTSVGDEVYEVTSAGPIPVVVPGDVIADGERVCQPGRYAVNAGGAVAFFAYTVPSSAACDGEVTWSQGVFVRAGGTTRRVSGAPSVDAPDLELLGIADDGTVAIDVQDVSQIVAIAPDGSRRSVGAGDASPSGSPFEAVIGLAISPAGEMVFLGVVGEREGLYRAGAGGIEAVLRLEDLVDGLPVTTLDRAVSINAGGDVVVAAVLGSEAGGQGALLVIPRGAAPLRLMDNARPGGIAADRSVALSIGYPEASAARWRAGGLQTLVVTGDRAPGGEVIATRGIASPFCLGADGRVATVASNSRYAASLVCVDAEGGHVLVGVGDPAPGGGVFRDFDSCEFADGDQFLFVASRTAGDDRAIVDTGVYRATAEGVEPVLVPGQRTSGGATVEYITGGVGVGDAGRRDLFVSNAAGTLLAFARTDAGMALLRRRAGGPLEEVRFELDDDPFSRTVVYVNWAGIGDDDIVVGDALLGDGTGARTRALVSSDGRRARVVLEAADPAVPGAPLAGFPHPLVRGDRVFSVATAAADDRHHVLEISLADGSARDMAEPLPDNAQPWRVRSYTAGGRLLTRRVVDGPGGLERRELIDGEGVVTLSDAPDLAGQFAVGVTDRRNLLTLVANPLGVTTALGLSGPPPEARCFIPPTALPQSLPTRTPTAAAIDCRDSTDRRCTRLEVTSTSGRPGERAVVAVSLNSGLHRIAGVQIDLHQNAAAIFVAGERGRPSCRVDPAINKPETPFSFQPPGCQPGVDCRAIRALVLSLFNVDPIPDRSLLFECDLQISAEAAPGTYPLAGSNEGFSDPDGNALPGVVVSGTLEVLASGNAPVSSGGGGGGNGCAVAETKGTAWPLLLAALLVVVRNVRHKRDLA